MKATWLVNSERAYHSLYWTDNAISECALGVIDPRRGGSQVEGVDRAVEGEAIPTPTRHHYSRQLLLSICEIFITRSSQEHVWNEHPALFFFYTAFKGFSLFIFTLSGFTLKP